jgi:hypothetical protein
MVRSGSIACDQTNAGGLHMAVSLATPPVSLLAGMGGLSAVVRRSSAASPAPLHLVVIAGLDPAIHHLSQ